MKSLLWLLFFVTASLCYCVTTTNHVFADSLTVSVQVGQTTLTLTGNSSPLAQITLKQDTSTIATTVADTLGDFTITVNVPVPGINTYTIFATNTQGYSSNSTSLTINALGNTNTLYTGLVLTPIIPASPSPSPTTPSPSATTSPAPSDTVTHETATPLPTIAIRLPPFLTPFLRQGHSLLTQQFLVDILARWINSWRTTAKNLTLNNLKLNVSIAPTQSSICDLNSDRACNLTDLSILLYYVDREAS